MATQVLANFVTVRDCAGRHRTPRESDRGQRDCFIIVRAATQPSGADTVSLKVHDYLVIGHLVIGRHGHASLKQLELM